MPENTYYDPSTHEPYLLDEVRVIPSSLPEYL